MMKEIFSTSDFSELTGELNESEKWEAWRVAYLADRNAEEKWAGLKTHLSGLINQLENAKGK